MFDCQRSEASCFLTMLMQVPVRGTIYLDDVAVRSVKAKKRSLFATGITKV
jgi:glutamate 5-kinase